MNDKKDQNPENQDGVVTASYDGNFDLVRRLISMVLILIVLTNTEKLQ